MKATRCSGALVGLLMVVTASRPSPNSRDPLAKHVVKSMDYLVGNHVHWNNWAKWSVAMEPFWAPDFTYSTVEGFPGNATYKGLRQWYDGEHMPFNNAFWPVVFTQMVFLGEKLSAATTTYANGVWVRPLGQMKPGASQNKHVKIRICDFYKVDEDKTSSAGGRIVYNWMMLDMVGLLLQAGHRVLPKTNLLEGTWVQPPQALDGIPAPNSYFVGANDTKVTRDIVNAMLEHEWIGRRGVAPQWSEDMIWYGPTGIGVARSKQEYKTEFIDKLFTAFSNVTVHLDVVPCEGAFCGAHGYVEGDHVGMWLGQPATMKRVKLRFGSHWHVYEGKIVEGWTIMDLPALFKQFGVNLYDRISYETTEKALTTLFE